MARLSPNTECIRGLFARSGNQCAFPGCTHELINKKNKFVGQVCHIEAAMPGGERYNPQQSDEDRRDYKNLLILCYAHHIETDEISEYTVDVLNEMKNKHEAMFLKTDFKIDEAELNILIHDMEKYWSKIERLNSIEHTMLDLAFDIDANASFLDIMQDVNSTVDKIEKLLARLQDSDNRLVDDINIFLEKNGVDNSFFISFPPSRTPFMYRNWETHNLGAANFMKRLRIDLVHIKIKFLEEYLKTHNDDLVARSRLEEVKIVFEKLAQNEIMYD